MDPIHPILPASPGILAPTPAPGVGRINPDAERRREQAERERRRRDRERERGGVYSDVDIRDDDSRDGDEPRHRVDVTA